MSGDRAFEKKERKRKQQEKKGTDLK